MGCGYVLFRCFGFWVVLWIIAFVLGGALHLVGLQVERWGESVRRGGIGCEVCGQPLL